MPVKILEPFARYAWIVALTGRYVPRAQVGEQVSIHKAPEALTKHGLWSMNLPSPILSSTGKPWCQASIGRLLSNPVYKKVIRNAGEQFPGAHDPIISAELWD